MAQMTAVQIPRAGTPFEVVKRAVPEPKLNTVRIRVQACGICHGDVLAKEGHWPGLQYPRVTGHEVAGELTKMGGAPVILATAPNSKAMSDLIEGLGVGGKLIVVGASADAISVTPIQLIGARRSIQGWPSGSVRDSEDALNFCALTGIRPMIETFPLEQAAAAYDRMLSGKARFRVVLTMN